MLNESLSVNSQNNCVLKEDYTFLSADPTGSVSADEQGLFLRDTRFLKRYAWDFGSANQMLLARSDRPDRYDFHYAHIRGTSQLAGFRRRIRLFPEAMEDRVEVENTGAEAIKVEVVLRWTTDFSDLFIARGLAFRPEGTVKVERTGIDRIRYDYGSDFLRCSCTIEGRGFSVVEPGDARALLALAPGERAVLAVRVDLAVSPAAEAGAGAGAGAEKAPELPSYDLWRASFAEVAAPEGHGAALKTAVQDLRALLLATADGPYLAAGIPWYVAAFGRDALISSMFLLPWKPDLARSTLRLLARYQGRTRNAATHEEPGKILHEIRHGELTLSGRTPYGPHYGTLDATPLYLMLLGRYYAQTGDRELVRELRPAWEGVLGWLRDSADTDGDGFAEHADRDGKGARIVMSWKDSPDSMSHRDGTLAEGPIAPCEVQGYIYDAYRSAAVLYAALGEEARGREAEAKAAALKAAFDKAYWLEDLSCYAMALDGRKRPLGVLSSNAGQLLWTGIVPEERAAPLVKTLFSDALWSGWGIRTLGTGEGRYNPVSYHNGSVWPHDTAIIALGLLRYGFAEEARRLRSALFELASEEADRRLPELVAGYKREGNAAVPYPVACRPQTWDAAALVALSGMEKQLAPEYTLPM